MATSDKVDAKSDEKKGEDSSFLAWMFPCSRSRKVPEASKDEEAKAEPAPVKKTPYRASVAVKKDVRRSVAAENEEQSAPAPAPISEE
mmetsp:Transcript_7070/g.10796  ORF Transcript_7070/g.10796 Transcript_7070/m.10796 type:complete len:88 (-) Transcript_7070:120-383(-)